MAIVVNGGKRDNSGLSDGVILLSLQIHRKLERHIGHSSPNS